MLYLDFWQCNRIDGEIYNSRLETQPLFLQRLHKFIIQIQNKMKDW